MTFVVPFDGSELAEAALVRAAEYGRGVDQDVVAVSVVPTGRGYALGKGWIDRDEEFVRDDVVADLHRAVTRRVPSASFQARRVGDRPAPGTVATELRRAAKEYDASVVFIGSDNAGRIVVSISSVGGSVVADDAYDVHIVRRRVPPKIDSLRPRPDFYGRT